MKYAYRAWWAVIAVALVILTGATAALLPGLWWIGPGLLVVGWVTPWFEVLWDRHPGRRSP